MSAGTHAPPLPPTDRRSAAPATAVPRLSRRTSEALAAYGFLSPWIAGMLLLTISAFKRAYESVAFAGTSTKDAAAAFFTEVNAALANT
jgi:hypothetical protein